MPADVGSRSPSSERDPLPGFESLVPARINSTRSTTRVSLDDFLKPPLLLHEDLKEGCGGKLWPAGLVLARYMLLHHPHDLVEKTILELGAGGGLVGLAVARGCQTTKPVIITDRPLMLGLMQQNIVLNALETKVTAEILEWGTPISPLIDNHLSSHSLVEGQYPDVVLAADCVYFEPAFPSLLQAMHQLLGPQTVCYFCFKKRRKADWRFIRDMKKQFQVTDSSYNDQDQDRRDGIYLYEVRRDSRKK